MQPERAGSTATATDRSSRDLTQRNSIRWMQHLLIDIVDIGQPHTGDSLAQARNLPCHVCCGHFLLHTDNLPPQSKKLCTSCYNSAPPRCLPCLSSLLRERVISCEGFQQSRSPRARKLPGISAFCNKTVNIRWNNTEAFSDTGL